MAAKSGQEVLLLSDENLSLQPGIVSGFTECANIKSGNHCLYNGWQNVSKFSRHFVYLELLRLSKHVKEETGIDSIEYELVNKQNPKQLKRCVLFKALPETG